MRFTTVIAPEELERRLGRAGLVVFDCRHSLTDASLGWRLYGESHVPNAIFAAVETDLAGEKTGKNGRHPLPDVERFADFLRVAGVNGDSQIIAYDAGADMFAARMWFLCQWIGHDASAILDGGLAAWKELGYPLSTAPPMPPVKGSLRVALRPELIVDAQYVHANLGNPSMLLLDARAKERYTGAEEPLDPIAGHIPGARHRWFKDNFEPNGRLKSPERLREELRLAKLDSPNTIHQCGSGVSSAVSYLAMVHAGLEGSRLFNGSWSEWVADANRPIAVGD